VRAIRRNSGGVDNVPPRRHRVALPTLWSARDPLPSAGARVEVHPIARHHVRSGATKRNHPPPLATCVETSYASNTQLQRSFRERLRTGWGAGGRKFKSSRSDHSQVPSAAQFAPDAGDGGAPQSPSPCANRPRLSHRHRHRPTIARPWRPALAPTATVPTWPSSAARSAGTCSARGSLAKTARAMGAAAA
jgi:hypothetical protein